MELVYKFRDWGNKYHRKILTENEIYLAPPNKINDPFDCRINENFSLFSEKEFERYIDEQIKFLKLKNTDINRIKIKNWCTNQDKLTNDYNILCKNIGIFSCCQDNNLYKGWQNILLWSYYSNEHKGFCVAFSKEKLFKYLTIHGNINYNKYPKIKPLVPCKKNKKRIIKNYKILLTTKEKRWKYENEFRFIKINTNNNAETGFSNEERILKLSNDCFVGVFLGVCIPVKHKNEITALCRLKNIPVFKLKMNAFDFILTIEPII